MDDRLTTRQATSVDKQKPQADGTRISLGQLRISIGKAVLESRSSAGRCVKKQLYNVLFMPDKGWLANSDSDNEDELRTHQMEALRTLCIPKIVLLLHTVLHSTGQYKEAIQLAEIVVDEQRLIYKVYSKQQMGELLSKIRESSLASLAQDKDPWGHPVVS
ncbi:hypothetical protein J6590_043918 [Homalodisca vitripennis]|nr:hypothetical protein J6590_043918 [Homalodisca vitripennis]